MTQLTMALFQTMSGSRLVQVPYRGGGPANIALISGETQAMISTIGSVATFLSNKQVRPLGVTSAKRVAQYPDIPAISETVPGYDFTAWVGVFVPAGTPMGIVNRLNGEFQKVLADPEVSKKLNDLTLEPMHMTPDAFAKRLKSNYVKYEKLIKQTISPKKKK